MRKKTEKEMVDLLLHDESNLVEGKYVVIAEENGIGDSTKSVHYDKVDLETFYKNYRMGRWVVDGFNIKKYPENDLLIIHIVRVDIDVLL